MNEIDRVRIDKWLWAARFFKTRSMAQTAVETGRVRVAGERIKPARETRIGEPLEIQVGDTRYEVIVRALAKVRGPAAVARELYEETGASVTARRQREILRHVVADPARARKGRPTKKEGRQLRRVRVGVLT